LTLDDVPALTALLNRIDAADGTGEPAEEPSIREWLTMPGLDLERDTLAARDEDALIGFVAVDVHTSLDRDGRVRCQLMGGGDPRRLLGQRAYRRPRSWLVMMRGLPGAALPSIEREQVRVIAPADEHAEATRLAHLAAFADHWGSAPVSSERWNRWWSAHTARRDLSSIALDAEGTVLAYVITSEDKPGVLHIALVGTRPEARGRGLARAVIARTLAAAAEAGYASAELEVDSESLTGATRLYDALGFARDAVYATYEKPVGRLV